MTLSFAVTRCTPAQRRHLIQINPGPFAICHSFPHQEREQQVTTNQAYFLVLVCGSFLVFAVSMAIAYAKYRLWLKQQPRAAD